MWKRAVCLVLGLVFLSATPGHPLSETDHRDSGQYLNMFLIEVEDQETAERVARDNGFVFVEKVHCCIRLFNIVVINHFAEAQVPCKDVM